MVTLVISLAAILFAAVMFIFGKVGSVPGPSFWYGHPWAEAIDDKTWLILIVSTALFLLYAILLVRRASAIFWFLALLAASLPVLMFCLPLWSLMSLATAFGFDAAGDVDFASAVAKRVFVLTVALYGILAGMAMYGYFARKRPNSR